MFLDQVVAVVVIPAGLVVLLLGLVVLAFPAAVTPAADLVEEEVRVGK